MYVKPCREQDPLGEMGELHKVLGLRLDTEKDDISVDKKKTAEKN
jgi:hypothetical protein